MQDTDQIVSCLNCSYWSYSRDFKSVVKYDKFHRIYNQFGMGENTIFSFCYYSLWKQMLPILAAETFEIVT